MWNGVRRVGGRDGGRDRDFEPCFTLMYLLTPTSSISSTSSSSLPSYIFEPGPYSLGSRIATFIYKGVIFAARRFTGLAGTAISNGLVALRERRKGEEAMGKKGPKMVLNEAMWAMHMGVSSNLMYHMLNAEEFLTARAMSGALFRAVMVVLRCLNNVRMSFVVLRRMMGSQKVEQEEGRVDLKAE